MATIFYTIIISCCSIGNPCRIPPKIHELIIAIDSNLRMVSISELHEDWDYYLSETECPTVVKGDFNGDKKYDYAMILFNKQIDQYQLAVAKSHKNTYELISISNLTNNPNGEGLRYGLEKYSQNSIFGILNTIRTTNDAFILYEFGSDGVNPIINGNYNFSE